MNLKNLLIFCLELYAEKEINKFDTLVSLFSMMANRDHSLETIEKKFIKKLKIGQNELHHIDHLKCLLQDIPRKEEVELNEIRRFASELDTHAKECANEVTCLDKSTSNVQYLDSINTKKNPPPITSTEIVLFFVKNNTVHRAFYFPASIAYYLENGWQPPEEFISYLFNSDYKILAHTIGHRGFGSYTEFINSSYLNDYSRRAHPPVYNMSTQSLKNVPTSKIGFLAGTKNGVLDLHAWDSYDEELLPSKARSGVIYYNQQDVTEACYLRLKNLKETLFSQKKLSDVEVMFDNETNKVSQLRYYRDCVFFESDTKPSFDTVSLCSQMSFGNVFVLHNNVIYFINEAEQSVESFETNVEKVIKIKSQLNPVYITTSELNKPKEVRRKLSILTRSDLAFIKETTQCDMILLGKDETLSGVKYLQDYIPSDSSFSKDTLLVFARLLGANEVGPLFHNGVKQGAALIPTDRLNEKFSSHDQYLNKIQGEETSFILFGHETGKSLSFDTQYFFSQPLADQQTLPLPFHSWFRFKTQEDLNKAISLLVEKGIVKKNQIWQSHRTLFLYGFVNLDDILIKLPKPTSEIKPILKPHYQLINYQKKEVEPVNYDEINQKLELAMNQYIDVKRRPQKKSKNIIELEFRVKEKYKHESEIIIEHILEIIKCCHLQNLIADKSSQYEAYADWDSKYLMFSIETEGKYVLDLRHFNELATIKILQLIDQLNGLSKIINHSKQMKADPQSKSLVTFFNSNSNNSQVLVKAQDMANQVSGAILEHNIERLNVSDNQVKTMFEEKNLSPIAYIFLKPAQDYTGQLEKSITVITNYYREKNAEPMLNENFLTSALGHRNIRDMFGSVEKDSKISDDLFKVFFKAYFEHCKQSISSQMLIHYLAAMIDKNYSQSIQYLLSNQDIKKQLNEYLCEINNFTHFMERILNNIKNENTNRNATEEYFDALDRIFDLVEEHPKFLQNLNVYEGTINDLIYLLFLPNSFEKQRYGEIYSNHAREVVKRIVHIVGSTEKLHGPVIENLHFLLEKYGTVNAIQEDVSFCLQKLDNKSSSKLDSKAYIEEVMDSEEEGDHNEEMEGIKCIIN